MKKILLVEDDKTIVIGLEYSLREEGYEVISCFNAAQACKAVKENSFDFAILDLSLPDGNGYDICRDIKAHGNQPVVFLTACDDEVNVVMGLDMGADDYITKTVPHTRAYVPAEDDTAPGLTKPRIIQMKSSFMICASIRVRRRCLKTEKKCC